MTSDALSITLDGDKALSDEFADYPHKAQRAIVRSLNRGMASGRTLMVREVSRNIGLKSSDVRNALRYVEATTTRPEASLGAPVKRISLIKFNAREVGGRGRGRGVSYRLPGGQGRHPHAFIRTMHSGHKGVFERKGRRRLPIRELFGPSLGHVFAKFRKDALARAYEAFATNLDHELRRASGAGSRGGTD